MEIKEFGGCSDKEVMYRLGADGDLRKKPPCADCESRGIICDECPDESDCSSVYLCKECLFTELCMGDDIHQRSNSIVPGNVMKVGEGVLPKLCFHLKSFYIDKIDNGFIIYYKRKGDEHSRKRFVPDIESLSNFLKQHTD